MLAAEMMFWIGFVALALMLITLQHEHLTRLSRALFGIVLLSWTMILVLHP